MAKILTSSDVPRRIADDEDLSSIRPSALALIIETFLDSHKVPLHTRAGAVISLAANYVYLGLKPTEKGDDA